MEKGLKRRKKRLNKERWTGWVKKKKKKKKKNEQEHKKGKGDQ